jgi:hypothetical protein
LLSLIDYSTFTIALAPPVVGFAVTLYVVTGNPFLEDSSCTLAIFLFNDSKISLATYSSFLAVF